jgi:HPt (histidine-containing phosphotransfer) domain-containing protein
VAPVTPATPAAYIPHPDHPPATASPSAASPGEKKPVDVSVLESLVGNDAAVISEFLHDFRVSSARIATDLRTACEGGQPAPAAAAAHKLKSSARSVGAMGLGELCAEMEQAGKAGDVDALKELLPRFELELAAVSNYIDSLEIKRS